VKLYSYVVQHDNGYAPNPYFGVCTLCRCKFRRSAAGRKNIVELAKRGEWVVGTGGASERSAGHGKLIYAMRVDEKLTREQYYKARRFAQKKPMLGGTYKQTRGTTSGPVTMTRESNLLSSRGISTTSVPKLSAFQETLT